MSVREVPNIPLFDTHSISWIAERTPYTEGYLLRVKEGRTKLTPRFKDTITMILRRPEAELFGQPEEGSDAH